ncbi:glycerol dehydrogenase [Commensalibacter papalotli (ex Servin-Garciduenas et al. 2014)]|uniref:Glycerol dehydrogenase n=1 Tax=Commensalibacter papalotli (ex Servin-Garciduenas et al. 2014) TaxID=1208583 RepID=W7DTT6_9PROT|nr:glycerol dehydrogenase [Commensalibacter papalotli (ex Servin-Garciduenas et al. 2014)]EUK18405.1 glycerol dehydrogenase [Commensalibacter papalotli (ex Servin-Garciduenas et al. 2014)]
MLQIIQSPSKYIQGPNALKEIGHYAKLLSDHYLVIADDIVMKIAAPIIEESLKKVSIEGLFERFGSECSKKEIQRLGDVLKANNCRGVIGAGGGKTLDTAKAVAYYHKVPVLIVPTIASNDAPTSALSVIYKETGEFDEYLMFPTNPDMVFMDTTIIAKAPVRLFVAGMGDALSTYFEGRACSLSRAQTMAGGQSTLAAMGLARLCYDTLLEEGYKAKLAVENGVATIAVNRIVEANTYLSGIGFESSGLAAAHAIHNGFTILEECHHMYHGEKVAFGTLTQLVLENAPKEELETVLEFCDRIGLPITLAQIGVKEGDGFKEKKIMDVAKASCAEGESIHNMPFKVTPEQVYAAILTADALGKAWQA